MMTLINKPAPDFTLKGIETGKDFKNYTLSDYKTKGAKKGKWVVLFFYPRDFTFICPTEITGFSKRLEDFAKLNAVILGASTDSEHSHKTWLKDLGDLHYPLLADTAHTVSDAYGVLVPEEGKSLRGTFIIDPDGIVQYSLYHSDNVGRSVSETLRVLAALQTGELCQMEWTPGKKTLGKK